MEKIKAYTTIEQSKVLAEILPHESADMYIYKNIFFGALSCFNGTTQVGEYVKLTDKENKAYPCWSLAALLDVLPSSALDSSNDHHYRLHCMERFTEWHDSAVDACCEMIIKLHELKKL